MISTSQKSLVFSRFTYKPSITIKILHAIENSVAHRINVTEDVRDGYKSNKYITMYAMAFMFSDRLYFL